MWGQDPTNFNPPHQSETQPAKLNINIHHPISSSTTNANPGQQHVCLIKFFSFLIVILILKLVLPEQIKLNGLE